jgi:hypothetical protein
VLARLGYEQAALCGAILVGHSGDCQTFGHTLQALLQRAGKSIGPIDGKVGPKTKAALAEAMGCSLSTAEAMVNALDESIFARLLALPHG